jgi:hypothetical protein
VDQAFYSLQNFAVAFTALRVLSLNDLGAFALASTLLILVQVALRTLTGEPLTIRFSTRPYEIQPAVAAAAGTALSVSAGLLALSLALLSTGVGSGKLVTAAAVVLMTLSIQDTYRFAFFATNRMWSATANDGVVCGVTLLMIWLLAICDTLDGVTLLIAWSAGSGTGAILAAWQLRAVPRPRCTATWLAAHGDIGFPLMGSVVAQQSMGRLSLVVINVLAGPVQLGLVTASRTVLSPVNTLVAATYSFAVPEAVRRREDPASMVRFTTALGVVLALMAVALTAFLLAIPDAWGRAIANRNWEGARALLVPTCLWIVGVALSQGARVGLRALGRTVAIFRLSLVLGVALLVATTIGTVVAGGTGAAWGFGIASLLGQPAWTWTYRRALRICGAKS